MNKKILFILLFIFLFIFLFNISFSFALDITVDEQTYTLPVEISNKKYILYYQWKTGKTNYINVFASDYEFYYDPYYHQVGSGENIRFTPGIVSSIGTKFYNLYVYSNNDLYKLSDFSYYSLAASSYANHYSNFDDVKYCNFNLKNPSGDIVFEPPVTFNAPQIRNKEEIKKLQFDNMFIDLNDFDVHERLYLHMLTVNTIVELDEINKMYYYNDKVFGLDFLTSYYNNTPDNLGYIIPKYKFELDNNKEYYFVLSSSASSITSSYNFYDYTQYDNAFDGFSFSTGDTFTTEQITQNIEKNQNDKLDEQNETSKGIWGTIKDILSYLNPFSENFFAYKLVDLIFSGLRALFIPSDEYFQNWFSDMNSTFADQFGILYYPVSVSIEFLDTLDKNLVGQEPIIHTPEFKLSFMNFNATLLPDSTYNFNDLLKNETFLTVHNFYLFFVNVIFTIGLIAFASKIVTEIFGGIDDSVDSAVYNSQADTRAYNRYARFQEVKKTYNRNQRNGGTK